MPCGIQVCYFQSSFFHLSVGVSVLSLRNKVIKTQNREIEILRLTLNFGRDHFSNQYTTLSRFILNTRVGKAVKLHQMSMPTREVHACRLNHLALVSTATVRCFGNYGGLQLLFSGGTHKTGTRTSCCDISQC